MKTVRYEERPKGTGNTGNQVAVDEPLREKFGNLNRAYEEGFAASHGARPATAETDGRVKHPDRLDGTHPDRTADTIEKENPGLADG